MAPKKALITHLTWQKGSKKSQNPVKGVAGLKPIRFNYFHILRKEIGGVAIIAKTW